jgi:hypothetical protein
MARQKSGRISGKDNEFWRWVGWLAVTVCQAMSKEKDKGIIVKSSQARNEMIWQLFPFYLTPQAELFIAAAGAIGNQHHLAATMCFPATFGNVLLVMVVLVFHLVKTAATGMIGSTFG